MEDSELFDVKYEIQSLDGRRPRFRKQIIGNEDVHLVLGQGMRNRTLPQHVFFFGASGSGKTTWGQVIARYHFCKNCTDDGDSCGRCEMCRKSLSAIVSYHERTGADLENDWDWWLNHGPTILSRPEYLLFLDEAQDLSKTHQKMFLRQLERARARVIFATTHRNAVDDAVVNRFFPNIFELGRPTSEQATDHLINLSKQRQVQVTREQLDRVVQHYGCDMRKCTNFVHSAVGQTQGKLVTDNFVNAILGITSATPSAPPAGRKTRLKL
jgi:DNA polymerase-3 subunit gamma/tau